MLSVGLKRRGTCVCVCVREREEGQVDEAGTRLNVICKLRDTPIPISIEILKPAGAHSQPGVHTNAHLGVYQSLSLSLFLSLARAFSGSLVRPSLRCLRAKKIIPGQERARNEPLKR